MSIQALTIIQPWAWCITHGPKRIENRTWAPPRSLVGRYLAIHAGKKVDAASWEGAMETAAFDQFRHAVTDGFDDAEDRDARDGGGSRARRAFVAGAVPYGAVVGVCRVVGHVTESDDRWFCGPIGWQLADVVAIEPIPCPGAQGLWPLPIDVLAQVRERWREARERSTGT